MNLTARRDFTTAKLGELDSNLKVAEKKFGVKASVYATGSYGRHEASEDSDLDLFIVTKAIHGHDEQTTSRSLSRLSEIVLKANLIQAIDEMGLPEFDGDGEYLRCYTDNELVKALGRPEDDALNTFTARLLLLLESTPLLGEEIYQDVIDDVIAAYWRDYQDHKTEFSPSFLVNDILRLWRTFCVNYEARTKTSPQPLKNKRRVKNYKLKHSRMLTCYSAVLNLLAVYRRQGTVHPEDFKGIVTRTPTERLEWLIEAEDCAKAHTHLQELLAAYEMFLQRTAIGSSQLAEHFGDKAKHLDYMREANDFGNKIFLALSSVGEDTPLYRHLMV